MPHEIQIIRARTGCAYTLHCSCGFTPQPGDDADDALAHHVAITWLTKTTGDATRELKPDLRDAMCQAALAWARADRAADDRAAAIHRLEQTLPEDVSAAYRASRRDAASLELRVACHIEGEAEKRWHELARQLLDDAESTS